MSRKPTKSHCLPDNRILTGESSTPSFLHVLFNNDCNSSNIILMAKRPPGSSNRPFFLPRDRNRGAPTAFVYSEGDRNAVLDSKFRLFCVSLLPPAFPPRVHVLTSSILFFLFLRGKKVEGEWKLLRGPFGGGPVKSVSQSRSCFFLSSLSEASLAVVGGGQGRGIGLSSCVDGPEKGRGREEGTSRGNTGKVRKGVLGDTDSPEKDIGKSTGPALRIKN